MSAKVYFLAKTRRSLPDGPIALGNIIADPRSPEIALNSSPGLASKLKVHETVEHDQSRTLGSHFSVQPTVWTKFVQETGLGEIVGEASVRYSAQDTSSYHFEKIVTREIFPDTDLVREAFDDPQVQKSIRDRRWQLGVFMITGVQIAYGAEVFVAKARETGIQLQTGLNLAPVVAAPVSVGVGLNVHQAPFQNLSTKYATPFVFAYRLRQIMYRRKKVEKQREYAKGDLLGINDGAELAVEDDATYEVQLSGLAPEDEELPGMFDLRTTEATTEGGEPCQVAFATTDDSDDSDS